MKLKGILLAVLFCVALSACNNANNQEKCLESVKSSFPNSKVYFSLERKFHFVVIDSNSVSIVKTMNLSNTNVSEVWTMRLAQ